MSKIDLQQLVTVITDILTPPNQNPSQGEIRVTQMSVGEALSREVIEKNQLPSNTSEEVGQLLSVNIFNRSICFGFPKKNLPTFGVGQTVFSSSAVDYYFKCLDTFVSVIPSFLTFYLNVVMDVTQKKKTNDDFTKVANEFIEYVKFVLILSLGADIDQGQLPPEFNITKVKDQFDNLSQKILKCLHEGDTFRAMKEVGQPTDQQEAIFAKEIQELNDQIKQFRQLFALLQSKLNENFDTLYIEQPYIDWQQYCKSITDIISIITILAYHIATYDPSQFVTIVQVLQQLNNFTFKMISPYLRLIRFRGKYDEYIKESKEAHEKLGTIFTPLLKAIIEILPKCPPPCIEFSKAKVTSLFTDLQNLHNEYSDRVENLLSALKSDRRFSSLMKVPGMGSSEGSEVSESSKGPLEIILKIVSQLTKQKSPVNEIGENFNKLVQEFQKFSQTLINTINKTPDINEKTRLVQQRDIINSSFMLFHTNIQGFIHNSNNNLLRFQAGIYAINLLLAFCNLDLSQTIIRTLCSLRPIVSENAVQFLPANTKVLIDLMTLINSRAADLPGDAREIFLGLYPTAISLIRESSTVFSANPDPNNPKNIGNCIRESDKLHPLLSALYYSINVQGLPVDLQGAAQLLSIFAFNIKYSADSLRLSIQSYTTHLITAFFSQIRPLIEFISNHATKLSEDQYQEFLSVKDKTFDYVKQLESQCEKQPPFGVFDFKYLESIKITFQSIMRPYLILLQKSTDVLKTIKQQPLIIKEMINSIAAMPKSLGSLIPLIDELYYLGELPIMPLIGPLLDKAHKDIAECISKLAESLKSNPSQASTEGLNLAISLNELANIMKYDGALKQFADQIQELSNGIHPTTAHVTLGVKQEIPQLASILQNLNNLTTGLQPMFEGYTNQLKSLGKQKAEELNKPPEPVGDPNVPLFPKGSGMLVDPKTGQKYPDLLIDQIPDAAMIDKLFMNAMQSPNEQLKALLNNYVDAIKKDVDEFLPLFAEYQRIPTPELLAKLNAIGSRILSNLKAYQDCLNFNPDTATEQHIKDLLKNFQDSPSASKALIAPEIILNDLAYANSKLTDPQQIALFNAAVAEILKNLTDNPELAYRQLDLLTKALLAEDQSPILEECIKELRDHLNKRDAQNTPLDINSLVFADRLLKILSNSSNPFPQEGSIQASMLVQSEKIKEEEKISDEIFAALDDLINAFEEILAGAGETEEINEDEIPDKIMDLNNEITELGVALQNDLKKSPVDQAELEKKLDSIKAKSLEVAGITSHVASRRQDLDKDTNEQLQDETAKVFESIKALEDAVNSAKGGSNARNAQRQVAKANRELNSALGALSDVVDAALEKTPSSVEPNDTDYNSYGNMLQNQILRLANIIQNCPDRSSNKFNLSVKNISKPLNECLDKFHKAAALAIKGADEEADVMKQVADFEKLVKDNLANPAKLDSNCPQESFQLLNDIRHAIGDALNTEIVAQPKAASSLPFRYSVPSTPQQATPASAQELLTLIEAVAKKSQDNLQSFTTTLNNAKSSADSITGSMNSFHGSVSDLLEPLDRMIASTWNPQSQNQLSQARTLLIKSADLSIDATRNRLLGSDGWREDIASFYDDANTSISKVLEAARKAFESAKADLSVTNEAERELVKAAQSVAESQKRLASMKSVAEEKKVAHGEGYLGLDILDISAPILSTAAKLIETAQAQTRFLLKRDPNLPNTKGLVKTAQDLVESLTLITVAAECTVNNEPDCISKVLAAANLVSSAAAHFLAEVYQKNGNPDLNAAMESITGSIQGLVKQLRAFGEAAQRQESEKNAASAAPSAHKLSSMIQKLNAEAKVVEARRALEEAELKLKKTRMENK